MSVNHSGQADASLVSCTTCLQRHGKVTIPTHCIALGSISSSTQYLSSFLIIFVFVSRASKTQLPLDPSQVKTRPSTTTSWPGCRGCNSKWDRLNFRHPMQQISSLLCKSEIIYTFSIFMSCVHTCVYMYNIVS